MRYINLRFTFYFFLQLVLSAYIKLHMGFHFGTKIEDLEWLWVAIPVHSIRRSGESYPRTNHKVDQIIGYDHLNFPRWWPVAILDLTELEIAPFDPTTPKNLP